MSDLRFTVLLPLMLAGCSPTADETNATAESEVGVVAYVVPDKSDPEAASVARSAFTELDMDRCRVIEENKEEGPYWRRRCSAPGRWRLEWSESDLRQGLTVISPDGEPEALIVRMNVANGVEPQLPDISGLAVVRLTGTPCLVAVIEPGERQNERARQIADGPMVKCLAE